MNYEEAINYLEDMGNTWEPEDGYPALNILALVKSGKVTNLNQYHLDNLIIEERKRLSSQYKMY